MESENNGSNTPTSSSAKIGFLSLKQCSKICEVVPASLRAYQGQRRTVILSDLTIGEISLRGSCPEPLYAHPPLTNAGFVVH